MNIRFRHMRMREPYCKITRKYFLSMFGTNANKKRIRHVYSQFVPVKIFIHLHCFLLSGA